MKEQRDIEQDFLKCCEILAADPEAIQGKSQKQEIVQDRHLIAAYLHEIRRYLLKEVGEIICRHHSTVLHSCEAVARQMIYQDASDRFNLLSTHFGGDGIILSIDTTPHQVETMNSILFQAVEGLRQSEAMREAMQLLPADLDGVDHLRQQILNQFLGKQL